MSRSPAAQLSSEPQKSLADYRQGWLDLNKLLRRGGSLSGREPNCCYLNLGDAYEPRFVDVSHISGFDQAVDGRAVATVDWDGDGDLDLWTSNRTGPRVQYFRNQSGSDRNDVAIRLQGTECNRDAIGARVEVEVEPSLGILARTVVAGDAYLSQSSKWLHFGLSDSETIKSVRVRWPGNSTWDYVTGVDVHGAYRVVQGQAAAIPVSAQTTKPKPASPKVDSPSVDSTDVAKQATETQLLNKTIVAGRLPLPPVNLSVNQSEAATLTLSGKPIVWLLWSPECPRCIEELSHFAKQAAVLRQADINVLAIAPGGEAADQQRAKAVIESTKFPFVWGLVEPQELARIEAYLGFVQQDYQRPITVPMSLLLDSAQQVAVVYRGGISPATLIADQGLLNGTPEELRQRSVPFPGTWLLPFRRPALDHFASELSRQFGSESAAQYFQHVLSTVERLKTQGKQMAPYPSEWLGQSLHALGVMSLSQGNYVQAERQSMRAQAYLPDDDRVYANHGAALLKLNRLPEALASLNRALEIRPQNLSALENRAALWVQMGRRRQALRDWERLLDVAPQHATVRLNAAAMAFALGEDLRSADHYRLYLVGNPESTDAKGALAWVLATSADAAVRDGQYAVDLVGGLQPAGDYKLLNIQAAAWAEVGDFARAIRAIELAIEFAERTGSTRAANAYRARQQLYRAQQPFRRAP